MILETLTFQGNNAKSITRRFAAVLPSFIVDYDYGGVIYQNSKTRFADIADSSIRSCSANVR